MTRKIFKGILCTALITMLSCLVLIIGVQYDFYDQSQKTALENEAYIISSSLEEGVAVESFYDYAERITVIDPQGLVLFDNRADTEKLGNHLDREEISSALKNGSGSAVRFSETFSKYTYYYAIKLSNGNILRISSDSASVFTVILQLLPPISAIILLTSAIALTLASLVSKSLLRPINSINPENPSVDGCYEELSPLIRKLRYQNIKINKQISQLTKSRREFEIISENMSEGMLLTDISGTILTHNKGIKTLLGLNGDINGKKLLTLSNSDIFQKIYDSVTRANRTEISHIENGRYYEITVNPVLDENSEPCGAVVLVIDVTEKQEHEKLRREFTANVSHELKTPLTSILGFSDILKEGIAAPEDVKGFGLDINREAKRLISLVNDIIKLSKLDEGAGDTEKSEIDLKAIATEVAEKLSPIADLQNICIRICGDSAIINASSSLVFEMVYNLCDNAVKYNREKGNITITTGYKENKPFISVKDTGIGIPPEHHSRIFERFYRVDKSRSNSGGTGLGLSIVKHIALITGGQIFLESTPNIGTEITVTYE